MSKITIWLTTGILLFYFIFTSGLVYEAIGSDVTNRFVVPYSAALSGERTGLLGVYTKDDIRCAEWLAYEGDQGVPIVGDANTWLLMKGYITQPAWVKLVLPPMNITGQPTFNAFGDSITLGDSVMSGGAVSTSASAYVPLIASTIDLGVNNYSISDSELADMFGTISGIAITPSTISIALWGYNDMKHFGNDADALTCFERNLYSYVVKLATPTSSIVYAQDDSIMYTGNWVFVNEGWGDFTKYTKEKGATATFTITGSVIYIDTFQFEGNTRGLKVEIDGIDRGTYEGSIFKSTKAGKKAGISFAPYLLRFDGLENTAHEVVLTAATGNGSVWFRWVAATDGSLKDGPYVYIGNCLPLKGSESAVASYNNVIANCAKTLASDGLRVALVDASAGINLATDLSSGENYLNDFGHRHIADAFLAAITPESINKTRTTVIRGGLYYIFLNTWNIENQKLVSGGISAGMREIKDLSTWKLDLYKEAFRSGESVVYERK